MVACVLSSACGGRADLVLAARPELAPDWPETTGSDAPSGGTVAATDLQAVTGLRQAAQTLLERGPRVLAAEERFRAAAAAVPQATRLPELQLEYAWLPAPVETRVGPNEHRIGLRQMVPFPTKLVARADLAEADVRRAAAMYDAAVRDALTELKVAWADLAYFDRALDVVSRNEELANAIAQLGATRSATGAGVLFDVARAQAQLAQLAYDRMTLAERRDVVAGKINALLGRDAAAPVGGAVPDEPLAAVSVELSEEALYAYALAHRQELVAADETIRGAEAKRALADSGWAPDLAFGAQLMVQGPAVMRPTPHDSGEEALAVTFGLSFPWSFQANAGASAQADAELAASLYDKAAQQAELRARIRELLFQARNAERLRVLYDEELLPHAQAALETAEQTARSDASAYADVLETRAVWYSFSLARERAAADQAQAIARLEQAVGGVLSTGDPELAGATSKQEANP